MVKVFTETRCNVCGKAGPELGRHYFMGDACTGTFEEYLVIPRWKFEMILKDLESLLSSKQGVTT
jgi:hypothetical protein